MKDLGKFILVQMYDRLMNENVQSSRVSQADLFYQIQNVFGNLTNFTRLASEEDFNSELNDLLHRKSVRQLEKSGQIYYQLTEKGEEQAEAFMTELQSHRYIQREPASMPLAAYKSLKPNNNKRFPIMIGILILLVLVIWRLLVK